MQSFAEQTWLGAWYAHIAEADLVEWVKSQGASKSQLKRMRKSASKARSRDSLKAATKLVDRTDSGYRFCSSPPLLTPIRDIADDAGRDRNEGAIRHAFEVYRQSLSDDVRHLLDRYELIDLALKAVGVGSVGTRCWIALCMGRQPADVLLLQIKEATTSVLEGHLPRSRYRLHGRRGVEGQRLMQASSDTFLGWSNAVSGHHYYWRQFKDWKGSADLDSISRTELARYAKVCGYTLARAHAVSGDPAGIAGYLGEGTVFDSAIGEFAMQFSAQNAADYEAFVTAIGGELPVEYDTIR